MKDKLKELKEKGVEVYSFSRLDTFNNCQYEFYNTYVLGNRGIDNCYTLLGSSMHSNIQDIYEDKQTVEEFKINYTNKLIELEMLGVDFPNEKIKNSWISDVNHFVNNFTKLDSKFLLEKLIVFEISDGIWVQGYIDAIRPSEKGKPYVEIIDWKTSSKFAGKKLNEAGRQLLMYKLGLENNSNYKVNNVMWFMIKYVYVCSLQKNGKIKNKMCNRGKWVKEIRSQIEKELSKLNMDDFEIELLLDQAVENNNLECLPVEVQNKFWLEDCFVECEITDEKIEELKEYVVNTVNAINNKDKNDGDDWKPVDIDKSNSFYCSVLCGHRQHCKYYKKFLDENKDSFEKRDRKDVFDIFN